MILAEFACPINAATHLTPIVRVTKSSIGENRRSLDEYRMRKFYRMKEGEED